MKLHIIIDIPDLKTLKEVMDRIEEKATIKELWYTEQNILREKLKI